MRFFREIWLTNRFFYALGGVSAVFVLGLILPFMYHVAWAVFIVLIVLTLLDLRLLYGDEADQPKRSMSSRFSNGDENPVKIEVNNPYSFATTIRVIDEAPTEFQIRNLQTIVTLPPNSRKTLEYFIRPVRRGLYEFGRTHVYYSGLFTLCERRISSEVDVDKEKSTIRVYPAFLELHRYELMAVTDQRSYGGTRQIRTEALSLEFDQIRDYALGDDPRAVNWAATARRNKIMVNQYTEERAQAIYSVIDTGRTMKMPFREMTLLDYAINASLALSKIALIKQDRPGLITWSSGVSQFIRADSRKSQLQYINDALFHLETGFDESSLEALFVGIRRQIPSRSTLLLYINFETLPAVKRSMRVLQNLSRRHLLVVVMFTNTEVQEMRDASVNKLIDVYDKAVAEDRLLEKELVVRTLQKAGIRTILCRPEELTAEVINRYLTLKQRGIV